MHNYYYTGDVENNITIVKFGGQMDWQQRLALQLMDDEETMIDIEMLVRQFWTGQRKEKSFIKEIKDIFRDAASNHEKYPMPEECDCYHCRVRVS